MSVPLIRSHGRSRKASCAQLVFGLLSVLISPGPAFGQDQDSKPPLVLQGKLVSSTETGPVLRTKKKDYPLSARTSYLFHTLEDKRLIEREVRLEGTAKSDGAFKVERLYTVREGKLYKVRYFCEVCNIEALEPGDCVCCQQPTELQEIPVTAAK